MIFYFSDICKGLSLPIHSTLARDNGRWLSFIKLQFKFIVHTYPFIGTWVSGNLLSIGINISEISWATTGEVTKWTHAASLYKVKWLIDERDLSLMMQTDWHSSFFLLAVAYSVIECEMRKVMRNQNVEVMTRHVRKFKIRWKIFT